MLARAEAETLALISLYGDPVMLTDLNSLENGPGAPGGSRDRRRRRCRNFPGARVRSIRTIRCCWWKAATWTRTPTRSRSMKGSVVGLAYEPLESARARYFGGTTNMWTGWCKPLDPIDLRRAPLARYCRLADLAARSCSPSMSAPSNWWRPGHIATISRNGSRPSARSTTCLPPGSSRPFGRRARRPASASAIWSRFARLTNISVLLNANLTSIRTAAEQGVVESVELRSLQGKSAQVRARCVVLACGGLENPRLLLAAAPGIARKVSATSMISSADTSWSTHGSQVGTILADRTLHAGGPLLPSHGGGHLQRSGWRFSEVEQERLGVQNCCC